MDKCIYPPCPQRIVAIKVPLSNGDTFVDQKLGSPKWSVKDDGGQRDTNVEIHRERTGDVHHTNQVFTVKSSSRRKRHFHVPEVKLIVDPLNGGKRLTVTQKGNPSWTVHDGNMKHTVSMNTHVNKLLDTHHTKQVAMINTEETGPGPYRAPRVILTIGTEGGHSIHVMPPSRGP
jgi:hypothetical protein